MLFDLEGDGRGLVRFRGISFVTNVPIVALWIGVATFSTLNL